MDESPNEADLRASYRPAYGCHIVTVEQYKKDRNSEWKTMTQLFCASEAHGQAVAAAINAVGAGSKPEPAQP